MSPKDTLFKVFQFHKGTIKTIAQHHTCYQGIRFNSIKVRLRRAFADAIAGKFRFQFHKGTIKT